MNCLAGIVEKSDVVISQLKLNYPDCKFNELDPAKDDFMVVVATPPAMHFEDAKKIIGAKFRY